MPGPVSRTVSIYIDQTAAQESADKLTKQIDRLTNTIRKGEAAGRDMSAQIANLDRAKKALNETNEIIAGRMSPSIRQLTQQANRLRNELSNMSRDKDGYQAKLAQYRQVNQELERMQRDLRGVREEMDKQPKSGGFMDSLIQGLGIGSGIALVQKGISLLKSFATGAADAASNIEQLQVAYTTLLGSKSAANDFIKDLQRFSAKTPFEFEEVAELSKRLLAFGFTQKEIIPTLNMLGNIASGVGKDKLPNLILAFSQVRMNGKLMAQDLNQLINAGFNPLSIISDKTGKSIRALRKDMENGLISFDQVEDAFKAVTEKGGRFYNLMQNQSNTTSGTLSNLKDNWGQLLAVFGGPINDALKQVYLSFGGIILKIKEWVSLSPADQVKKEKDELNGMVFALMQVNDNQQLKSQLISEIKAKYPQFLSYIDAEKASTEQLGKALELVNQQYDHKIRLAALDQRQQRNSDNSIELQNAYLDAQQRLADRLKLDVVQLAKMSAEERQQVIQRRVQEELAIANKPKSTLDKMLSGAGGSEGARGIKITDVSLLNQYAKLDEDYATKKKALDDERLKIMGQIGAENDRQLKQDQESLRIANENIKTLEKNKDARIAAYTILFKNKQLAKDAYEQELKQAKQLAAGIEQSINPIHDEKPKPTDDTPLTAEQKKAIKQHEKAVKDVQDLQQQLAQLQADIKAAQVDADAGFEDRFGQQIQAIADKYEKLMNKVRDRIANVAGLTKVEKDALEQLLVDFAKAKNEELGILNQKQTKERDDKEYKNELKALSNYYQQQRQIVSQSYVDGQISYQEYQDKLTSLDAQEAESRATMAADYAENVKAAAEDLETAKTKALEKGIRDRRTLEERERDERMAILQLRVIQAAKGTKQEWEAQRNVIIQSFEEQKKQKAGNAAEIALLDAQEKEQLKALDAQYWKQKLDNIANVLSGIGSLFNNFLSFLNQGDQNQLDQEQARNDEKKKSYQKMLDNKQISQEQYDKYVNAADAETEKKEIEIKKRMAKREKAMAMFNAVIQTAQAVLQALASAPPPWNIALAAISAAAGAIQLATIAGQKEPQFKDGGIFDTTGGIAKGASHASGGISLIDASGKKVGEMEGDEAYMILSKKTTAANRDIIEKLLASSKRGDGTRITPDWMFAPPQQINYKDAIETINFTRQYRNGGITVPTKPVVAQAPAGASSSDQKVLSDLASVVDTLNKKLDQPFKGYFVWTDFQQKQKQYDLLVKEASLNPTG